MFGKLGQLASLMGNLPKIKEEMEKLQERLGQADRRGRRRRRHGARQSQRPIQTPQLHDLPRSDGRRDREMLEDLIVAATNQAVDTGPRVGRRGNRQDGARPGPAARHEPAGIGMTMTSDNGQNLGPIAKLVQELTRLPGIGPKSAERLTFHLIGGDRKNARDLAAALQAVAETVHACPECFNLADGPLCSVCSNPRRDPALICVVETPRDLAVFERAGTFRGRYHVLGGRLAPLDNMGPEQIGDRGPAAPGPAGRRAGSDSGDQPDARRRRHGPVRLEPAGRDGSEDDAVGRGLPSGASLDLVNAQMLSDALEGRRAF